MSQKCFECWLIVDFFQHRCHCHPQHFYCVFISTLALPWSFLLSLLFLVLPWHWQLTSMIQDRLRLLFKHHHHHHHSSIFLFPSLSSLLPLCFCKSMILVSLDQCRFLSLCGTPSGQHSQSRGSIAMSATTIFDNKEERNS